MASPKGCRAPERASLPKMWHAHGRDVARTSNIQRQSLARGAVLFTPSMTCGQRCSIVRALTQIPAEQYAYVNDFIADSKLEGLRCGVVHQQLGSAPQQERASLEFVHRAAALFPLSGDWEELLTSSRPWAMCLANSARVSSTLSCSLARAGRCCKKLFKARTFVKRLPKAESSTCNHNPRIEDDTRARATICYETPPP